MTFPSPSTLVAIAVAYGLLLALSRRPVTALALTSYLLGFVLLSSYMKQAYLGSAMTLADMHFFLLRPRENFHLFVNYPVLGVTLIAVMGGLALVVLLGIKFETPVRLLAEPGRGSLWRWSVGLMSIGFATGASLLASQPSQARANDGDAWAAFQAMYVQLHPGGPLGRINVFFNNRSFEATLPPAREQARFKAQADAPTSAPVKPDILLVLEESTFDPTLIRDCPKAVCDHAMLHPLRAAMRTRQGPLLAHTTGGGTWLAEFAVVSGFDWRVFGRGGAYAPVSLAPRLRTSLPQYLRSLGYRTIAIYPTEGNFLSATTAYGYYGFDEFYARRDLGLPDEWGDVRDRDVFERTFALVEKRHDSRPVFVFMLTIRNHGPHGRQPDKIPQPFLSAATQFTPAMADYLARMRDSSNDFVQAATRWLQSPQPRVIAWFGDHQPEAAWDYTEHLDKLDRERLPANVAAAQSQYLTVYQLSANFGAPETAMAREALDLSYLGAELLSFAQLPLDVHAQVTRDAARACNGLMLDCADRSLLNDYLSFRVHELHALE